MELDLAAVSVGEGDGDVPVRIHRDGAGESE